MLKLFFLGQKISELLDQGLPATEIGKMLKINERSVRRWRMRIEQLKKNPEKYSKSSEFPPSYKLHPKSHFPHRRYVKCVDRATVDNIRKLLETGATNKEICVRLGIPMSIVSLFFEFFLNLLYIFYLLGHESRSTHLDRHNRRNY